MASRPLAPLVIVKDRALRWGLRLLCDESGQDLVEYGLIVGLVALGAIASLKGLATAIGTALGRVGTGLTGAV